MPVEPAGPFDGVIEAPALLNCAVSLKAPFAAGSLRICVAVASVALVTTYDPGVATEPGVELALIALLFDDVGVVALKLAGSLTALKAS